ncbi:MAG: HlyC/CorC family transporter [Clostridia bacterium]|nr:HlyC/CorC family transporter [Clostridia bacterium]
MDPVPCNFSNVYLNASPVNSDNVWMIIVMSVLLLFSAFFSSIETSFTSFNRVRIKSLAQNGDKRAKLAMKLDDKYDKLLISVLIGNNVVNIALSTIATMFFVDIIAGTDLSKEGIAATISTIIITVVVLIFGEITPKVAAKETADKSVLRLSGVVNVLIIILTPFSLVFGAWSKLMNRLFRSKDQASFTEDELITIVDEAEEDGAIESDEGDLIRSAIEFNDVCAGDILTPRVEVCAISKDESVANIAKTFIENAYSRLPVYGEDMDDIVGILHQKDFFIAYHNNNKTITKHLQKPVHVSEHIKIADLLQVLKRKKCHMAIVVDEYGGTMGIVTMEDIIEELIGDVFDEHDEEEISEFKQLDENTYLVSCSAELDDFFEKFEIEAPDDEDLPQTVNGFVMKELEAIPQKGDVFQYRNLRVEITKIGPKRIEEIKVTVLMDEDSETE